MAERLPGGPPPEAIAYLEGKGFRQSFHWQDVWGEEHAHAFTVAKAMEMDVLTTLREATDRAVRDGVPYQQFAKELTPRLQALGWWGRKAMTDPATGETINAQLGSPRRLQIIYWANTRTAYAAGQWERAQRTKGALPYFIYELGPSEVHRPHHVALAGTVLPVDHAFWDSHYPPNGWGCKCRVRPISRFEAERVGGVSAEPDISWRDYRNKRTGEISRVPEGVDPGWHTNPGKARARTLMRGLSQRIEQAGPDDARAVIADLWRSRTPEAYVRISEPLQMPVAFAPEIAELLGAAGSLISVSNGTMRAKQEKHRHVEPGAFGQVQEIIDSGEMISRPDGSLQFWLQIGGLWWVAAIRKAATGFARLVTLHSSSDSRRQRALKVERDMREK